MTPYGIVYKESIHAYEQSVRVWQKNFGVLKGRTILKLSAFLWILAIIVTVVLFLINTDVTYALFYCFLTAAVNVISYMLIKSNYIKQISTGNYQNYDKQIVLFEDRMEITTSFGKGCYYYDEILLVHEKNAVITIIIDEGAAPYCIFAHGIKKGEYGKFLNLLVEKTAPFGIFEGGAA